MSFWARRPVGGNSSQGCPNRRPSPESLEPEPSLSNIFPSGDPTDRISSSPGSISPHPELLNLPDAVSSREGQLPARGSRSPTTTTTTTTTVFTRIMRGENYWPKIREVIEKSRAIECDKRVNLCLDCPICQNTMLRFPTPIFPMRGERSPPALTEKITVLFCGHVFHYNCMRIWMRVCAEGDNHNDSHSHRHSRHHATTTTRPAAPRHGPSCPNCRESLVYGECGHAMNLKMGSPSAPQDVEARIPLVRDEGGRKPARCAECQLEEINKMAERMSQLICESGDKDMRSQKDQGRWRDECKEQLQTTAALKHLQWAKRSNRW